VVGAHYRVDQEKRFGMSGPELIQGTKKIKDGNLILSTVLVPISEDSPTIVF
jgi:hypothetical protein